MNGMNKFKRSVLSDHVIFTLFDNSININETVITSVS